MANIVDTFANTCGIKLPPSVTDYPSNYIYIPEKYIVIFGGGDYNSGKYDHFNIVVKLLQPYLGDIKIVQIGVKTDPLIRGCLDYRGKSDFKQTTFIIENSLMLISGDSVWNYVAGSKGIPFLILCAVTPAKSITPKYKGRYEVLESHRNGNKPSFDGAENPKTINLIKPEDVADRIAANLGIGYTKITTKKIGNFFGVFQIDYIPDCPPQQFSAPSACRMDVYFNIHSLIDYLKINKGAIVTNSPIDIRLLMNYKANITQVIYFIGNGVDVNWVEQLHNSGIKYDLLTDCIGEELNDIKFKLFDYKQVMSRVRSELSGISPDDSFESTRIYHGRNKPYFSLWHYKHDISPENDCSKILKSIDDKDFLECVESLHIYQKH